MFSLFQRLQLTRRAKVLLLIERQLASSMTSDKTDSRINASFASWKAVTKGVPQGSKLRPQIFTIYFNDSDEWNKCTAAKCTDNTQMVGKQRGGDQEVWKD